MYYSTIGLLAVLILLIENHDILLDSRGAFEKNAWKVYRKFLFTVLVYYIADIFWGFLESKKLAAWLFADTTVYFGSVAAGVLFWSEFTMAYLEDKSPFGRNIVFAGRSLAGLITLLSVINIFEPVLFTVDGDCVYRTLPLRYGILVAQILLLLLISGYSFSISRLYPTKKGKRNRALTLFGLIMAIFLFAQLWFPYLPLYAIAYLLGTCLLHTYVVDDEKEEYKRGLEEAEKVKELRDTIVSLLDNMPAMTFTKDAETGVYLACNQAFADYAHKESPSGVVGHTAQELFDPETAKQFDDEDEITLSLDRPYVFFEDTLDAVGNRRQLQTTKLRYYDTSGQLCVLGMCQDVTDTVRIQREDATTKESYEKARSTGIIFNHMAQAMAQGYLLLFYVHLDSEEYIKYRTGDDSDSIVEEERGWHFFEECRRTAERIVHPEDREDVVRALKRKTLEAALDQNNTFVLTFRYLTGNEAKYVTLKVSRTEDDEHHIILGITDVDEVMRHRRAALRAREENNAYTRLSALSGDYLCVYIVEPKMGAFRVLSANQNYESFRKYDEGEDFFNISREIARKFIYSEDLNRFLSTFTRENVMAEIERRGIFTLSCRLIRGDSAIYVQIKAAMVEEEEGPRLIVGISDIDAQVRQEEEYVKRMAQARLNANIDALTGVKNRHAYLEAEERLNHQIVAQDAPEFAIVLLDVNDLKKVNDVEGHNAGDQYLRGACRIVCNTFKHSPVFRVGGDEFAVVAQGSDYNRIEALMAQMDGHNAHALNSGGIVIACGMAKYDNDECVAQVFERADHNMYVNKSALKDKKETASRRGSL